TIQLYAFKFRMIKPQIFCLIVLTGFIYVLLICFFMTLFGHEEIQIQFIPRFIPPDYAGVKSTRIYTSTKTETDAVDDVSKNSDSVVDIITTAINLNTSAVTLATAAVNINTSVANLKIAVKTTIRDKTDARLVEKLLKTDETEVIKILLWNVTDCDTHKCIVPLGSAPFEDCEIPHCELTTDHSQIENVQNVMFHTCEKKSLVGECGLPKYRSPKQKWIFWCREPPSSGQQYRHRALTNAFNFTITTRLDSDFHAYHGVFKVNPNPPKTLPDYAKGKTKMAAWIVSHCKTQSRRELYVQRLQKYMPVDIYGKCGRLECPSGSLDEKFECFGYIGATYKFYIAFENSDCRDYVTEKVWRNAIMMDTLPVVRGFYNNFETILPPGSYIHTNDFPNPKALADYLIYLDKNDTAYNEYFKWKLTYM
ncbi:unnamed protein product, partial [Owenia fusiformis]